MAVVVDEGGARQERFLLDYLIFSTHLLFLFFQFLKITFDKFTIPLCTKEDAGVIAGECAREFQKI